MKKIRILLVLALCLAVMAFVITSCNKSENGNGAGDTSNSEDSSDITNSNDSTNSNDNAVDSSDNTDDSEEIYDESLEVGTQGLEFTLLDDGTYAVSVGSATNEEEIVIPQRHSGKVVSTIASSGFENCTNLKTVKLPAELKSIESKAFKNCCLLETVTIPKSVEEISPLSFTDVKTVYVSAELVSMFGRVDGLERVVITSGKTISYGALSSSDIKSVEICEGVTRIEEDAFRRCLELTEVKLPNSIEEIGNGAFMACMKLETVKIPDKAIDIEKMAFEHTPFYEKIKETCWENGMLYINRILVDVEDKTQKSYAIKEGTLSVTHGAFSNCTELTSVEIPSSVIMLGSEAFSGCTALTSIEIPNGVITLGSEVFSGCIALTSVEISSTVKKIGSLAFSDCKLLTSITLPNGLNQLGSSSFHGCDALTSIEIPSSVKSIYSLGCDNLVSLKIGSTEDMSEIADGEGAIIFDRSFLGLECLEEVIIGNHVQIIGENAFSICEALEYVYLGSGIEEIGKGAFSYCTALESIRIPQKTVSIEDGAFSECEKLTSINIPKTVKNIGIGALALTNIKEIALDDENDSFCLENGILYTKDKTRLIICTPDGQREVVTVANETTTIDAYAFVEKKEIKQIILPQGLIEILNGAFYGCEGLQGVNIPSSVIEIGKEAFALCSSLKSIEIPQGIYQIQNGTFLGCASVEEIIIPDSVKILGRAAFAECTSLKRVVIGKEIKEIDDLLFYGNVSIETFEVAEGNEEFSSIDGNLYSKDGKTLILYACGKKNEEFVISKDIVCVMNFAFQDCTNLKYIYCEATELPEEWSILWNDGCDAEVVWGYVSNTEE